MERATRGQELMVPNQHAPEMAEGEDRLQLPINLKELIEPDSVLAR